MTTQSGESKSARNVRKSAHGLVVAVLFVCIVLGSLYIFSLSVLLFQTAINSAWWFQDKYETPQLTAKQVSASVYFAPLALLPEEFVISHNLDSGEIYVSAPVDWQGEILEEVRDAYSSQGWNCSDFDRHAGVVKSKKGILKVTDYGGKVGIK